VAPEGVYSVTDEHKLSLAQNHAANAGPSIYPTKVCSVVVRFTATKQGSAPGLAQLLGGNKEQKKGNLTSLKEREDGVSLSGSDTPDEGEQPSSSTQEHPPASPSIPHEHHTLFSHSPIASKKKNAARPKHNIRTTSSSFITRIQTAEGLTKTLQAKQGDATFLFFNQAKSYVWVEAGSKAKVGLVVQSCSLPNRRQEPLSRITFSAHPTCHDVNISTSSSEHLDVIIGFNSGDLVWLGAFIIFKLYPIQHAAFRPYHISIRPLEQTSAWKYLNTGNSHS